MKVLAYQGARTMSFEDRPKPRALPGEAVVEVKYCGICGSDLHAYMNGSMPPGVVFGHEVVGTVAEIGEGVRGWRIGDRVMVQACGSCNDCYYCRHGQLNLCIHAFERTNGISPGYDGGLAKHVRVRYPRDMLHKIPENVSFEDAVLLDTMAVALGGIRKSRFQIGNSVTVVGAGAIGLCALQFLRLAGARHISVVEPSPERRDLALRFGADIAVNPDQEGADLRELVFSLFGDVGPDVVYECAGTAASFQSSLSLVRSGGQVLLLGVNEKATPIAEVDLIVREIDVKGSIAYEEVDVAICFDFLKDGRFRTEGLISDIISLDDAVEKGFERLAASRKFVKIVVAP